MNKEEKFKIWDATFPSVSEVKEYLDRICGTTPLPLVFKTDNGKFLFDNQIRDFPFVGVLIENMIFYAKGFSSRDRYEENGCTLLYHNLSVKDIDNWIKQNIDAFAPNAHPVYENNAVLLYKHQDELRQTAEILEYHQAFKKDLRLPKLHQKLIPWFQEKPTSTDAYHIDGMTRASYFLESFGDFWICSKKS